MEYLDILDEKGNKTGEVKSYDEAHQKGLTHMAVHVWFVNSNGEILIQKREKNRVAYPGYWDISASGHVSAGESSLEAAQKETREELGVACEEGDFKYLFTLEEHIVINNGTYINNEFQDVFLVQKDISISDIKFTDGEVEAVKFVSLEEFKKYTTSTDMVPHAEEYERLLSALL